MRKIFILFLFVLNLDTALAQSPVMQQLLSANWQFRQNDQTQWYPAIVPGCVHTDLIRNQLIKDPFLGTNEKDCEWVGEKDWVYETIPFDMDPLILDHEVIRLRMNGLDTYADVYLNDQLLLNANNAFRTWEVDAKKVLRKKGNVMRIIFKSPIPIGEARLKSLAYPLPGDGLRAVTRKPQFHFGWDWGPKLITSGISKKIEWIAYSEVQITEMYVEQTSIEEKRADIKFRMIVHSLKDQMVDASYEVLNTGVVYSTQVTLKKGMNIVEMPLTIEWPRLWWCNDVGEHYLYEIIGTLQKGETVLEQKSVKTGLRTIELVNEKDSIGESFYFKLNGLPIFAKGANYIPITYFPATATEEDYKKILTSCKDAHMNMLRVWGGGVYEDEKFYELCDEMGIMVWQDFMFACSMYPADSTFVVNVIDEADEITKRLRNHPCIALWCGNNENEEGWERWGWQTGLSDKQKAKLWRAYLDIFDLTLGKAVKKNTNTSYWMSSPRYGRGDARSLNEGDSHYWGVWHDEEPFEVLNKKIPRFMSEYGMQSFPSTAVWKEMLTGSPKYNDAGFEQHQKHNRGFKLMDKYMSNWYPTVSHDSLELYARMTQVVQAEGIGLGIEAQRRNMHRCMGTMYWQLNDVWPSFSWSGMDYKGNPKLLHQYLSTIYAPQLISCVVENGELKIYLISDNHVKEESLVMEFDIVDAALGDNAKIYESSPMTVELKQGSYLVYSIPLKQLNIGNDPRNKIISVRMLKPSDRTEKFSRQQKLVPESPARVVPVVEEYQAPIAPKAVKKVTKTRIGYKKI
jgi:beta-mannosidase